MLTPAALLLAALFAPKPDAYPLPPGAVARYGDPADRGVMIAVIGFSPDNKTLVRHGMNGVMFHDLATGKNVTPAYLDAVDNPNAHLLHDGRHFHLDRRGGRVADPRTGETLHTLAAGFEIGRFELTPDGKGGLLSDTTAAGGKVAVVDFTAAPPTVRTFDRTTPHTVLSPDRTRLYGWDKGTLSAVEVKTGKVAAEREVKAELRGRMAVTPDGKRVLLQTENGIAVVPVTADGFGKPTAFEGPLHLYDCTTTTADGGSLILMDGDRFDFATGGYELIRADHQKEPKWNRGRNWPSADGTLIATDLGPSIRAVVVWEAATGKTVRRFDEVPRLTTAVPTDGGKTVTTVDEARVVRRYDAATGKLLEEQVKRKTDTDPNYQWALPFDGGLLEVERLDTAVRVSDPKTGEVKARLDHGVPPPKQLPKEQGGGGEREVKIESADVRPELDRAVLAVDGRPVVVELSTGKRLRTLEVHCQTAALSPDGRLVAAATEQGVTLTEVRTGKPRREMTTREFDDGMERLGGRGGSGRPTHLRFTPDGSRLAVFGVCGGRVWTAEGERVAEFPADQHGMGAISPDGKRVVVRLDQRFTLIELGEADQSRRLIPLRTPHGYSVSAEFTPDGKLLTAHADGMAYLWDVDALARLHRTPPPVPADAKLWDALADADGLKAGAAVDALVKDPALAVRVIGERLKPVQPADAKAVAKWVEQLADADFKERERAEKELAAMGDLAADALRAATESDAPERVQRAERLLAKMDGPETDPERVRLLRAVEVLERAGTPEAKKLLEQVATGEPASGTTREAKAALARLAKRGR